MTISLLDLDLYILNMKTRMPFRYGIAVMTALPCLFVRLTVEIDGQPVYGFSSDGLAPKWFTKDPESHYRDDIADMLRVVQQAFRHGQEMGGTDTIFALWRAVKRRLQGLVRCRFLHGRLRPLSRYASSCVRSSSTISGWSKYRFVVSPGSSSRL